MIERDWTRLYRKGWTGLIVPEAFCHPAKFSRGLIRRIYQYAMAQGWLQAGDLVCDPFGGVALGALHAMQNGLHWVGVELEEKFVALGQQNIDLWNARYADHLPAWGSAAIRQGDSRRLCEVVGEAAGVVGSPPYAKSHIASLPGQEMGNKDKFPSPWLQVESDGYSENPGNLGNLPAREGDFDAAVGSPPYAGSQVTSDGQRGIDTGNDEATTARRRGQRRASPDGYSTNTAQLGSMPPGHLEAVDGVCGSPPWEQSLDRGVVDKRARVKLARAEGVSNAEFISPIDMEQIGERSQPDYGTAAGQLGQSSGDTFWSASRQIMQQVHAILKPSGVAIWVCKRFVRNKQIVEFSQQWAQLGLACGFEPLEWIRAWLVEDRGAQFALNGDLVKRKIERKSFFRRLAESKGSPRIDWEDVIVQRKLPQAVSEAMLLFTRYERDTDNKTLARR